MVTGWCEKVKEMERWQVQTMDDISLDTLEIVSGKQRSRSAVSPHLGLIVFFNVVVVGEVVVIL